MVLINLTFCGAESCRRDTRVQLKYTDALQYFIDFFFLHRDQNISCKLSSVFLMIKRLNGLSQKRKVQNPFDIFLVCLLTSRVSKNDC